MRRLNYSEGDIFIVPLSTGAYALGLVARSPKTGKVLLGYFFRAKSISVPTSAAALDLELRDAVMVARFGDLHLIDSTWPIVGPLSGWQRADWPMPKFRRESPLVPGRVEVLVYADDDPSKELGSRPGTIDDVSLPRDGMLGAGAVERALARLTA